MFSLFRWQKIIFKTSQFNHFAFCRKSTTYDGHNVVKIFFATRPTNPIWVWVQRIPSFFLYYCKQKFYNHFCKAWGFMLQNQGNMPWWGTAHHGPLHATSSHLPFHHHHKTERMGCVKCKSNGKLEAIFAECSWMRRAAAGLNRIHYQCPAHWH